MKIAQIEPIIDEFFKDEGLNNKVDLFLEKSGTSSKWMLYSDYCLDDKGKKNDVMTFALIPFLSEEVYLGLESAIHSTQPKDIKKTKEVDPDFLKILKVFPIFSYSFILDDRSMLFGRSGQERVICVTEILEGVKVNFETWSKNADDGSVVKNYYDSVVKKLNTQLVRIKQKGDTKLISDIILTALLGSVYASKILKRLPQLDIVGWFPDRDKSNEGCDNIIVPIFNSFIYNRIQNRNTQWAFVPPDTSKVPFYDNENRIVDFICGTIADYDFYNNKVTKDKFCTVLEDLLADNPFIRIYKIKANMTPLQIASVLIEKK